LPASQDLTASEAQSEKEEFMRRNLVVIIALATLLLVVVPARAITYG
jgi:hypothetical protein